MSEDPDSPSIDVDVILRDPAWADDCSRATALVERAARAALAKAPEAAELPRPLELAIVLSDDAEVRGLNRDYRHRDRATNVLSFPHQAFPHEGRAPQVAVEGQPFLLGDVILARETVAREAAAVDKPLAGHLSHLVVHGVLHLLGYDHESEAEAARMEALEVAVLAGLGFEDPYRAAAARKGQCALAPDL